MWPFKRRTNQAEQPAVPTEVQEYYQAERRERTGVAWLLAAVTLIVTLVLAVGLFFGGRWAYRKFAHRNTPSTQQTASTENTSSTTSKDENTSRAPTTPAPTTPAPTTPRPTTPTTGPDLPRTGPDQDL